MFPTPDLSWEKHGMVWVEIKVLQDNMMNSTNVGKNLSEFRLEVEEMVSTIIGSKFGRW
jgi:hypothetical protein